MVRIVQCLCPQRHAIMGVAYEEDDGVPLALQSAIMKNKMKLAVEDAIAAKLLNPWCGICNSRDWHYEDGRSKFATLDEAAPELARLEAANTAARAIIQNKN